MTDTNRDRAARADARWAKKHGFDPLPPEHLDAILAAVVPTAQAHDEAKCSGASAKARLAEAKEALQDKGIQLVQMRDYVRQLVWAAAEAWDEDKPLADQVQEAVELIDATKHLLDSGLVHVIESTADGEINA